MEIVIDTLKIYERLKAADLPEKASKEIAEVLRETIEDRLATKKDLTELEKHLDFRLKELESSIKADLIKWVAGMLVAQAVVIAALVKLL